MLSVVKVWDAQTVCIHLLWLLQSGSQTLLSSRRILRDSFSYCSSAVRRCHDWEVIHKTKHLPGAGLQFRSVSPFPPWLGVWWQPRRHRPRAVAESLSLICRWQAQRESWGLGLTRALETSKPTSSHTPPLSRLDLLLLPILWSTLRSMNLWALSPFKAA